MQFIFDHISRADFLNIQYKKTLFITWKTIIVKLVMCLLLPAYPNNTNGKILVLSKITQEATLMKQWWAKYLPGTYQGGCTYMISWGNPLRWATVSFAKRTLSLRWVSKISFVVELPVQICPNCWQSAMHKLHSSCICKIFTISIPILPPEN